MELTQLRYFQTVARLESFTQAAQTLHVSQSALSKAIAKLEEELGFSLFVRERNSIHLNRCGTYFLEQSRQSVSMLEHAVKIAQSMAGLTHGEVYMGVSQEVFVKHLVRDFLTDYPNASVFCYLLSQEQMAEGLKVGTLDFAVSTDWVQQTEVDWIPIYQDHLEVLIAADHPLAKNETLSLEDLKHQRFVVSTVGMGMRDPIYDLCQQAGFTPDIMYEGYDADTPILFVESGRAVMLTPYSVEFSVRHTITPPAKGRPLVSIPIRNTFSGTRRTIGIAIRSGSFSSDAARELQKRIIDFFSTMSDAEHCKAE